MAEEIDTAQLKMPCEVYSRIVGYLRPLRDWNKAKRQEYEERKAFVIGDGVIDGERGRTANETNGRNARAHL